MSFVLGALVVVVAALVIGAVALARSSKKEFDDANVIVAGEDTGAPADWAGAHSPEARLHRRIRDAVRALQANADLDGHLTEARVRLEGEALAIDRRLVSAAALPDSVRAEPMERVTAAVVALEEAAADAALAADLTDESVIGETTQAINDRLTALAEARAALEEEAPTTDPVERAEQVIESTEPAGEEGAS
jgi:hypothetical protein